jgi:hypothetical protein
MYGGSQHFAARQRAIASKRRVLQFSLSSPDRLEIENLKEERLQWQSR